MNYILYARYSPRPKKDRNGQAIDCYSVENQLESLREYVESVGGSILGEFSDKRRSGKDILRPGLRKAMRACGEGGTLLVTHTDRLARNLFLVELVCQKAERDGFEIASLAGPITGKTPAEVLQRQIQAAIAQFQRAETSRKTSKGMRRKMRNGEKVSSKPPYGWVFGKGSTMKRDDKQQAVIKLMLLWLREGESVSEICRRLSKARIPAPSGGDTWHNQSVKRILDRETANS